MKTIQKYLKNRNPHNLAAYKHIKIFLKQKKKIKKKNYYSEKILTFKSDTKKHGKL